MANLAPVGCGWRQAGRRLAELVALHPDFATTVRLRCSYPIRDVYHDLPPLTHSARPIDGSNGPVTATL